MKTLTAAVILCAACNLAAQAPPPGSAAAAAPSAEISTIAVPIRSTLAPLLPQIEAQVPKAFRESTDQNGFTITYSVQRDPVNLTMVGTGLHATTTAHYSLQVCRGNLPCVSCGIDERQRRADIALHTHLLWDRNWRIRSVTSAQPVHFPDRCRMTFLRYDITDRFIAPVVDDQLRTAVKVIDRNTPALTNIRPSAQQIWSSLQAPYEIAPRTWLVFEPVDVGLAPLRGEKLAISTILTIRARSRIVVGEKPKTAAIPLPALLTREATGGIRVPFDIEVPYGEATRLANERFGNRGYRTAGAPLTIGSIRISPAANGRIAVDADIDYRGGRLNNYRGPVHLEGTPRIDASTNNVVVPDLDYTVDTAHRNLFVRTAERLVHDDLRARLRDSATYPLTKESAGVQDGITRSLARQLSPGVVLQGRADGVHAQSVTAAPDALHVSVVVTGAASVQVDRLQ